MRRARATTATVVPGARYIESQVDCEARICCHKLRTLRGSALQRRPAGARRRRGRQPRALHDACPCSEPDGGHSTHAPGAAVRRGARWAPPVTSSRPGGGPSRWPAGRGGPARAQPAGCQRARGACWRAFCCSKWGREGSRKIRAARRAQDWRSPLTVKRTRAHAVPTPQLSITADVVGSRSGLRGTGALNCPAKVAHPMALGVTGASAWSPAAFAPAPPHPAPPTVRVSDIGTGF